jgi:hypothetical protein
MEEQIKKGGESKKFGPMTPKERDKFNELENRIIKIETAFHTIGVILKWTSIVVGIIATIVTLIIRLWPWISSLKG